MEHALFFTCCLSSTHAALPFLQEGSYTSTTAIMFNTKEDVILWIGGTSSLARTFFVNYQDVVAGNNNNRNADRQPTKRKWILTGLERDPRRWMTSLPNTISIQYVSLNLTGLTVDQANNFLAEIDDHDKSNISSVIVAIRPLLFDKYIYTDTADRMVEGLEVLLKQLALSLSQLHVILHISSVAAANHLRTQSFAKENDPQLPLDEYTAPYDRCKRQCEDVITNICQNCTNKNNPKLSSIHLRLSAIFSDDRGCIQCSALGLQARVGCYLPLAIDCNSSLNVSKAIYTLLLQKSPSSKSSSMYYYTRPLTLPKPVPYGYYLSEFRRAYGIQRTSLWIPVWVVTSFVSLVHSLAYWNQQYLSSCVPYLDAADYLLQVAAREHSFDNGAFRQLLQDEIQRGTFCEETILECFVRRRGYLQQSVKE
jgi:hypothetical protein